LNPWFWVLFNLFIIGLLALDLGVLNRRAHHIKSAEALRWCAFWVALALGFNLLVYFWLGSEVALQFLTGYLIEYSLSIDNIFVFILIFSYFRVPSKYQHRVLFWGILGALILRATLILTGVGLLHAFEWVFYVFGAFLVYSGIKFIMYKEENFDPERNPALRLARRLMPVAEGDHGNHFFTRLNGKLHATELFIVLIVIETTDLVFALDSIPAILAITQDAFVVYTSNVFAILGLRSLYFALAGIMELFRYLKYGLSIVLIFIGLKMCLSGVLEIPILVSLGVVVGVIAGSVFASLLLQPRTADTIKDNDAV
jgi:tellurite resistance protein TerC